MRTATFALLLILALPACSDPEDDSRPSSGGSTAGGSSGKGGSGGAALGSGGAEEAGGAGGEAPACNEIEIDAPAVGLTYDADLPPEATGGEIADGTYFLTAQIVYETDSGIEIPLGRTQVEIDGDTWQEASGDPEPGGVNPDLYTTSTLSTDGTFLTLERSCPNEKQPDTFEYSAASDAFTIYVLDGGLTLGTVFTRQ